jgi:hypothetical protein
MLNAGNSSTAANMTNDINHQIGSSTNNNDDNGEAGIGEATVGFAMFRIRCEEAELRSSQKPMTQFL